MKHDRMKGEKKNLAVMVEIFCADNHSTGKRQLCSDCGALLEYALNRLEKCPFGPDKGPCSKCEIHCYKPEMRDKVKQVMRYSGPKMIKTHPILAVKHLLDSRKKQAPDS